MMRGVYRVKQRRGCECNILLWNVIIVTMFGRPGGENMVTMVTVLCGGEDRGQGLREVLVLFGMCSNSQTRTEESFTLY